MGKFRKDQFSEQHCENTYFPWASRKELVLTVVLPFGSHEFTILSQFVIQVWF